MPTKLTAGAESETLHEATHRYRLHNPNVSNAAITKALQLQNSVCGDHVVASSCYFFRDGRIVAVRTKPDELAINSAYVGIGGFGTHISIGDRIE